MGSTVNATLHYSSRAGWKRCIATQHCWYGQHGTPFEIAAAGGAEVAIHSRPQTVSELFEGGYSVGTAKRTQTFTEDGRKMTAAEAKKWRRGRAMEKRIVEVEERGQAEHFVSEDHAKLWAMLREKPDTPQPEAPMTGRQRRRLDSLRQRHPRLAIPKESELAAMEADEIAELITRLSIEARRL